MVDAVSDHVVAGRALLRLLGSISSHVEPAQQPPIAGLIVRTATSLHSVLIASLGATAVEVIDTAITTTNSSSRTAWCKPDHIVTLGTVFRCERAATPGPIRRRLERHIRFVWDQHRPLQAIELNRALGFATARIVGVSGDDLLEGLVTAKCHAGVQLVATTLRDRTAALASAAEHGLLAFASTLADGWSMRKVLAAMIGDLLRAQLAKLCHHQQGHLAATVCTALPQHHMFVLQQLVATSQCKTAREVQRIFVNANPSSPVVGHDILQSTTRRRQRF